MNTLDAKAAAVIKLALKTGMEPDYIANVFGVYKAAITKIQSGRNWTDVKPAQLPLDLNAEGNRIKEKKKLQLEEKEKYKVEYLKRQEERRKSTFPLFIRIDSQAELDVYNKVLAAAKKRCELELSKVLLMLDAIERNDFSDLPPSCLKELEALRAKSGIRNEHSK